jgi:hypothetical protein
MWPLYYDCIETSDICNFARYCYNNYDNFHILGIQPVYGYMENKVNEWVKRNRLVFYKKHNTHMYLIISHCLLVQLQSCQVGG